MQYDSLMINTATKQRLKKLQEELDKKHFGKHTYSAIIDQAIQLLAEQEGVSL